MDLFDWPFIIIIDMCLSSEKYPAYGRDPEYYLILFSLIISFIVRTISGCSVATSWASARSFSKSKSWPLPRLPSNPRPPVTYFHLPVRTAFDQNRNSCFSCRVRVTPDERARILRFGKPPGPERYLQHSPIRNFPQLGAGLYL